MISTLNTNNKFTGNGVTRDWVYSFSILSSDGSEIEIYLTSPTGVVTKITTSYSIDVDTATVTYPTVASLLSPVASGWVVELRRVLSLTQDKNLSPQGEIDADALEAALDKVTLLCQQTKADVDTGVPGPTGATGENGAIGNAGDINAQDEKTSFADNDIILIEDSADSWKEKKVKKSNLGIDAVSLGGKTVGTTANKILALDGDAKIPAVDGSQVTGVDAETLGGKSVGTSANNVVALDGDAKLPAVDGSQLTGVLGICPAGAILAWTTNTPPATWLICDGSTVSQATYAALFAVIGHTYGADPGGGNFILPNLKGKIPVGRDSADANFDILNTPTTYAGEKTHTLTGAESGLPSHSHSSGVAIDGSRHDWTTSGGAGSGPIITTTGGAGPSNAANAHNNLQPYVVINYIIKV